MPDQHKLLSILSDQPADEDRLNFDPYVQTLTDIITEPGTATPLTIGIFGDWGQGKTSLMRMVERRLNERTSEEQTSFAVIPVWFNAWLYNREEAVWRALVARVLQAVLTFPTLDLVAATVEETTQGLADLIADLQAGQTVATRDRIVVLDDLRHRLEAVCREHIADNGRLVVFVDDLDRCLPELAVQVLEAVKLLLDVPGIVVMLGADQRTLEEGIRARYGRRYGQDNAASVIDATRYLEKIIQIPLNLPLIQPATIEDYVAQVTAGLLPDLRCQRVFTVGMEPNPRRIKRTLNMFLLLWRLAQNRADLRHVIKPVRLAKIVIIQQHHRRLFDLLTQAPHYLIDLERLFREMRRASEDQGVGLVQSERQRTGGEDISAGPLQEYLGRSLLRDLLTCTAVDEHEANFIDLNPVQVAEYLFLTRSATQEGAGLADEVRYPFEPQMVVIPAGSFVMGTALQDVDGLLAEFRELKREWVEVELPQHSIDLPVYAIGRYPVTVAEFGRFVEDGGYRTSEHWTRAGWRTREREGWTQPRYWDDGEYNAPAQPVVGVSWHEAVAYCNWLTVKTGKPYRLPSEAEWEKAARGTDGRRYPWGDHPPAVELCNFGENIGRPTPVGQYSPQGDGPYGCADMAGNVWEWTRSVYRAYPYDAEDGREDVQTEGPRVLRGGAFHNGPGGVRCAFRDWDSPDVRYGNLGFRVVVSLV